VGAPTAAAGSKGLGGHFDERMSFRWGPCVVLRMLMRTLTPWEKRWGEFGEARIRRRAQGAGYKRARLLSNT
jgi:hypothetical protein